MLKIFDLVRRRNSITRNLSRRDVEKFLGFEDSIVVLLEGGGGVRWTDWFEIVPTQRMLQN